MSAIKYPGLKIFSILILLLIFISCNRKESGSANKDPNEIILISYSEIGGPLGNYSIIKVTEDSIHAEQGVTKSKTHKEWKSALSPQTWRRLISNIDVKALDRIKSSPSQQSVDGFDETFQIRTSKKYHAYVNAFVDTAHYGQLKKLKDQMRALLPTEYN
ncbi:hypothetical protein FY557_01660 [Chryseobacterium sp. SN22]|uniref:hypothetical protein n=1 Tax=Chryseobacterium sp. SN22 TaxID=2606431 RepID=UPI0011EF2803|nr:hypothetical protein [Chryseobacterium sp. SN22]KAA0130458.1 hypothetical protein FY557_01660 [Chryseobacterium sp. SN22]